jgi:hypothetical protein
MNAVCNAIVHILQTSMAEQASELGLENIKPSFAVYQSDDFSNPDSTRHVASGASVFLYRVLPNLSHRTPSGNLLPNGQRQYSKLPLDLYLLVTIWGNSPSTQNRLVGWVIRTLEDYTQIPASVLNLGSSTTRIFEDSEAVELLLSEMDGEELLQLWDMLGEDKLPYQITIPYLVRNLVLESRRVMPVGGPVQVRTSDMQRLDGAPR